MARNLIDLLDEDNDYDFEDNVGQRRFRLPREDREQQNQNKKRITQERKKRRKQKEDVLSIKEDMNGEY